MKKEEPKSQTSATPAASVPPASPAVTAKPAASQPAAVTASQPAAVTASQPAAGAPPAAGGDEYAVLTTSLGDVVIDVFEDDAPKHAENFKKLVKQGFYNGLTFHRVIENYMAQGGDPQGNGSGGPGYTLPAEIKRPHLRGSVAAARTDNPEKKSSGSQFYICFAPQPNLDRMGYTVFGQVVKGMEVVDKIQRGDPGENGLVPPAQRTKIVSAKLVPATTIQK